MHDCKILEVYNKIYERNKFNLKLDSEIIHYLAEETTY
jgi:hypothetical protein